MDSSCDHLEVTNEVLDKFCKHNCTFCHETYFIQDLFMCSNCSKEVCNSCTTSNCKWIHVCNDCDFCYYFVLDNGKFDSHTLHMVCSSIVNIYLPPHLTNNM